MSFPWVGFFYEFPDSNDDDKGEGGGGEGV